MALAHTILATLGNNSLSGYDLWKSFSQCGTYYWKASQQQIYRELAKLEKEGAISFKIVVQQGRPDKKIYTVTAKGKKMLICWIAKPSSPAVIREELLVKVLAAHLAPVATIIEEVQRRQQLHKEKLANSLKAKTENFSDLAQLPLEKKCMYLNLSRRIRLETQWVEWCDEALTILREYSK